MLVPFDPQVASAAQTRAVTARVVTSNTAATTLTLEVWPLAPASNQDGMLINLQPNGTTNIPLDPGEYVFGVNFRNVNAAAAVTINVTTGHAHPMVPQGPISVSASRYEPGSTRFVVRV